MNLTHTIQLTELLWTLVAIPGLLLWVSNRMRAGASLRAVQRLNIENGRRRFALFAVRETTTWAFVEVVFVAIGVVAMTNAPNPSSVVPTRLTVVGGLIIASVMITILGLEWRLVDQELVRTAVAQVTAAQDGREVVQNVREEEQNTRDTAQDSREAGQNTRQTGQNDRQTQQDARDADTGSE